MRTDSYSRLSIAVTVILVTATSAYGVATLAVTKDYFVHEPWGFIWAAFYAGIGMILAPLVIVGTAWAITASTRGNSRN